MQKLIFIFLMTFAALFITACGEGGKEEALSEKEDTMATTENEVESAPDVPPLKTKEELREMEKIDETALASAEDKMSVYRFSSSYNLKELPAVVLEAKNLQTLELNNYQGTNLPEEISTLQNLTVLYISGSTKLESLPESIIKLKNLKTIAVTSAKKLDLPKTIDLLSKVPNLQNLQINYSQEGDIPSSIGDMKQLEVIDLTNNSFKTLPDAFYNLPNLKTLKISSKKDNAYNYEEIFEKAKSLPKLEKLVVLFSGLSALPEIFKEYPSLKTIQWREEGAAWTGDALDATIKTWNDKFPDINVSYSTAGDPFYNYF